MHIGELKTLKAMGFVDPNLMPDACFGAKMKRNRDIVRRFMRDEKAVDIARLHGLSVSTCYDIVRRAMVPFRNDIIKRRPKPPKLPEREITVTVLRGAGYDITSI